MKDDINYDSIRCNFLLPFGAKRGLSKLTYYTIISNDSSSYEISRRGALWKCNSFGPLKERVKMGEFSGRIFFSAEVVENHFSDYRVGFSAVFNCGKIQSIELVKFELIKFMQHPNKSPEIIKTSKIKSFINKYTDWIHKKKYFLV